MNPFLHQKTITKPIPTVFEDNNELNVDIINELKKQKTSDPQRLNVSKKLSRNIVNQTCMQRDTSVSRLSRE